MHVLKENVFIKKIVPHRKLCEACQMAVVECRLLAVKTKRKTPR